MSPKNTLRIQRYNHCSQGSVSHGVSQRQGVKVVLSPWRLEKLHPALSALGSAGKLSVLCPQSTVSAHPLHLSLGQSLDNNVGEIQNVPLSYSLPLQHPPQTCGSGALLKLQKSWHLSAHHPSCPQHLLTSCTQRWPQNPFSPKMRLGEEGTKDSS